MKPAQIFLLLGAAAAVYYLMNKAKSQNQTPGQTVKDEAPGNAPENNPGNIFVRDIDASKPTDGLISIRTGEDQKVYNNPTGNSVVYLESETASYNGNLSGIY